MRDIQYYRPSMTVPEADMILISGYCPEIKTKLISEHLTTARERRKLILIDFAVNGDYSDFSRFLTYCGYPSQHVFVTDRDNYSPSEIPIREAISKLRTHSQRLGYDHESYSRMTAFLSFLISLETPSDRSHTIGQLLKKFGNREKLEKILLKLVRNGVLTGEEAEERIQTYFEFVSGGLTADTLLSELEFLMTPNETTDRFSLSRLKAGEAAILSASKNNSTDINDYMSRLWTSDIIAMAEREPLSIIINTGSYPQIERMYELVETMTHNENVKLFYTAGDLFSGTDAPKAKAFAKMFVYNFYGCHANDSAQIISSLFSQRWYTQYNYASSRDNRILHERLLDKIVGTDNTLTVSTVMVKESIIPADRIVNLNKGECVIFNTLTNDVYMACI